jgi:hypothetical protein
MSSLLPRRIPRPSAALLVAFAALFTALAGTGYAAAMITGANVANSSLTGVDVKNKSLGQKELKPESIDGTRVIESKLGTVPSAEKAGDANTLDGIDSAALMTKKTRTFEASFGSHSNFGNNANLGTLADVPAGEYVVTAKLGYYNPGALQVESCTLHMPGSDDTSTFYANTGESETISLQEAVTSATSFSPSVSCTADPTDDMLGTMSIIAVKVD